MFCSASCSSILTTEAYLKEECLEWHQNDQEKIQELSLDALNCLPSSLMRGDRNISSYKSRDKEFKGL